MQIGWRELYNYVKQDPNKMQQPEHRMKIRLKADFSSWYLPRRSRADGGMTTGSNNKSYDQLIQNTRKKKLPIY